jgi:hypothetical protein
MNYERLWRSKVRCLDLCTTSDSFQLYFPNNSPVKKQLYKANILILLYKYLGKQLRFRYNSFK